MLVDLPRVSAAAVWAWVGQHAAPLYLVMANTSPVNPIPVANRAGTIHIHTGLGAGFRVGVGLWFYGAAALGLDLQVEPLSHRER